MICKHCDQRIPNDSEYCPFCGLKVSNKKASNNIVALSPKAKQNSSKSTALKTIVIGIFVLFVLESCVKSTNSRNHNSDDDIPSSVTRSTSSYVTSSPEEKSEISQTTNVTTEKTIKVTTAVTSISEEKETITATTVTTTADKTVSTTSSQSKSTTKKTEKTKSTTATSPKVTTEPTTVTTARQTTTSAEPDEDIVIDDETTDDNIELDDEPELPKESETTKKQTDTSFPGDNFTKYNNPEQQDTDAKYILNTNTKKFHRPSCNEVKKIYPENYSEYYGSRDTIILWDYDPCKKCNP